MIEGLDTASDGEELCCRNSVTTTSSSLKTNFKFCQPEVGCGIVIIRVQRKRSWVKDQLHAPGLTGSIMLTWVTTHMNHYTRALAQSGTFGSRPRAKAKECLDDLQYFLSSGFRIGRRTELTSKLKVEVNPVILKIEIR